MPDTPLNRIQFGQTLPGGFSNADASGSLPSILPSPLYLNLGCGHDIREGFLNIDLFSDDPRVIRMDIRRLELPDGCADGILASDVLEHFSHRETDVVLKEWARLLRPGGQLMIRCPSLSLQMKAYASGIWDADIASYMIFGGQTNPGDYHCIGFDQKSILRHLQLAGLEMISFEEQDTPQERGYINLNMTVVARKPVSVHPISGAKGPQINLVWEGSQFVWHSLALINREQCLNVLSSGVAELTTIPYESDQFSADIDPRFAALARTDIRTKAPTPPEIRSLPYVWVRHQWPPKDEEPKGAYWIINQPWEFSTLRRDFVSLFDKADELWTPSTFSRNSFIRSGIQPEKVQIIPNGIRPSLFTPYGGKHDFQSKTGRKLTFLFVGGTIFRKGIDILLGAFCSAFKNNEAVRLIIKDMGGDTFYKGQTAREYITQLQQQPDCPEIIYMDEYITEEQMAAIYRGCDVFISPYRGEGFSLPTLEAMACGLPVIVTAGGATDDFTDEFTGWHIPAHPLPIGNTINGYELTGEAFLLEPEQDYLKDLLLDIYEYPEQIASRGINAAYRARKDWTWNKATLKMLSRLDILCSTTMALQAADALQDKEDGIIAFGQAEQAYLHGDIDLAINIYQAALSMGGMPERYTMQILNRLALLSLEDGDNGLALEFLEKAGAIQSENPDFQYVKALTLADAQLYDEALELMTSLMDAWKIKRFDSMMSLTLDRIITDTGNIFYACQEYEDAITLYKQALSLNPENADACLGSALCFRDIEAAEEMNIMLEWAIKLNPLYEQYREQFA
jgi:glycosyltransferase involved in cell wall biosynthesis